jgi:hypothetical protein
MKRLHSYLFVGEGPARIDQVFVLLNKDGADNSNTDPPSTTIKQDPEAELVLNKVEEVHVKSEPEVEF